MQDSDIEIPPQLLEQIRQQEGLELQSYWDPIGKVWTIGYGHTPSGPGVVWTEQQAETALMDDVTTAAQALNRALPWAQEMGVIRWAVFCNMVFNLGIFRFLAFHDTINAAQAGDWEATAQGMADSLWADQVGIRATHLEEQMRTGEWVLAND